MKILIAEDDPVSGRILEKTLIGWGHEVLVATDGRVAWEILQEADAPLLAILDIMMPEMDGCEVCRKVRRLSSVIQPYLILLTALSSKEDVVRGMQAGANEYLTKPFHRAELKVRVEGGLRILELQLILSARIGELEVALSQVKQLQGLLPFCSYCHKVRGDQNYWQKIDSYISQRTDVELSHGICPMCLERVTSELSLQKQNLAESMRPKA